MKPLTIFYLLVTYIFIQFCWWASLLVELQRSKWVMVVGEGTVFMGLLAFGAYKLRKAIKREEGLSRQQKNFLLSVTHELKSPLTSVKLTLQTLLKRNLDKEKAEQLLGNSLEDVERLDELIENMLIAARVENRSYIYHKEQLDLSQMVQQITAKYVSHHPNIQTDITEGLEIKGDRISLGSVIMNLVDNAIKYSPEKPIYIRLNKESGQVILEVRDQGYGIAPEEKKLIFQKFYRVGNEETRRSKGTGLGLFIVKQVLDEHQAAIQVLDNMPSGTVFKIIFPA